MILKKAAILVAFVFLLAPDFAFGQYNHNMQIDPFWSYFKDKRRYELAFNYVIPSGYFEGVQRVNYGSYTGDTTLRRTLSGSGFGGSIGLSLPFKATGHISCWAATIQLAYNTFTWPDLNSTYDQDGALVAPTGDILSAGTSQISLPIGIDWKVGNDAICSKRLIFGASMGAGVIPGFNMTSLQGISGGGETPPNGMRFSCTPFVKVEGSVFIGWDVKVRAMYTMGDVSLIEVNRPIFGMTDGPFKVGSTSQIIVSLVLMPFSGGWREWAWYNTYDTYNQADRFN